MMSEIERFLHGRDPFLPSVDLKLLNLIIRDLLLEQGYYEGEAIAKGLLLTGALSVIEPFTRKHGDGQSMVENFAHYASGFNRPLRLLQLSYAGLAEGLHATRTLLSKFSADEESSFVQDNLVSAVDSLRNDHSGVDLVNQVVQKELLRSNDIYFQVGLEAARRTFMSYHEIIDTLVGNLASDPKDKPGPLLPFLREYEKTPPLSKPLSRKAMRLEKTLARFAERPSCSTALPALLANPGLILSFFRMATRLVYNVRKNPEAALREMQKASAVMPKIQEIVRGDWQTGELASRVEAEFAYVEERFAVLAPQASYPSRDFVEDIKHIRALSRNVLKGQSAERLLEQWRLLAKRPGLEQYSALWTTVQIVWGDFAKHHFEQTGEKRFLRIARRAYTGPLKKSSAWKADLGTRCVCGARLGELLARHGGSLGMPVPELARAIYRAYSDALHANERLYQRSPFRDSKTRLQDRTNLAVARVIESCFYLSEHDEGEGPRWRRVALVAAENGKSRILRSEMALAARAAPSEVPSALHEAEAQLLHRLRRKLADDLARQSYFEADVQSPDDSTREYNELYLELEGIWVQIENYGDEAYRYAAMRRDEGIGWEVFERVAHNLGPRVAIVSIFRLPEAVLVALVRKDDDAPQVRILPFPGDTLLRYLGNYDAEILERSALGRSGEWWERHPPTNEWQKIGELLFAPLESLLSDVDCVYFLPHGPFHRLPLHALTIDGNPFIERWAVAYAPSISVLDSTLARSRTNGATLVMGYDPSNVSRKQPATAIYQEAYEVAEHFNRSTLDRADSESLKERGPSSRLIHISCHGSFDPRDPLNSGVYLADGVFTARDWLELRLQADLVTLSACESGIIKSDAGDDLLGLVRAVLFAGAASVLTTLASVDAEKTRNWMIKFYRSVWTADGTQIVDKATAFRLATLEVMSENPDPYLWAPFALVGSLQ